MGAVDDEPESRYPTVLNPQLRNLIVFLERHGDKLTSSELTNIQRFIVQAVNRPS